MLMALMILLVFSTLVANRSGWVQWVFFVGIFIFTFADSFLLNN